MAAVCAEKGAGSAVRIFELVAQFLEQCNFTTAAHAVLAQCSEHVPALEEVLRRFRGHIDHCALLLSDLEAIKPGNNNASEAFIQDLLDNLLRKLMASGQCLSDEKLLSCIDATLKSDAFPKLDVADIVLDPKQVDTSSMLNIKISQADADDAEAQKSEPLPSSHYLPKRRDAPQKEVWDVDDEYHDDEDPGYRIREIYEAELLAELSQKMPPTEAPTEADELTAAATAEQGQGEGEAEKPESPEPSGQRSPGTDVSLGVAPTAGAREAPRSASPTFGGAVEKPEEVAEPSAPKDRRHTPGFGYGESAKLAASPTTSSRRNGRAKLSPAVPVETVETLVSTVETVDDSWTILWETPRSLQRNSKKLEKEAVDLEAEGIEDVENVSMPESWLRDADVLEAWSRGETLIIEDEVKLENGQGLVILYDLFARFREPKSRVREGKRHAG
eukprot:g17610.t1